MYVSTIGYILVPLGLVLFIYGRRPLMWATIMLSPFFMIRVFDLGVARIEAFQFMGSLFILRSLVDSLLSRKALFKKSWANVLALVFLVVCFLSLVIPVVKSGMIDVYVQMPGTWTTRAFDQQPLRLSVSNFTQILYPLWGITLFCLLVRELKELSEIKKTINVLVWSSVVISLMNVAGGVLYIVGEGELYHSFLHYFTVGQVGIKPPQVGTFGRFYRAYTLGGEPGLAAMSLLLGGGLLVGLTLGPHSGKWNVRFPRAKLVLITLGLILNGSTTGYLAASLLIIWCFLVPFYFNRTLLLRGRKVFASLLIGVGLLAVSGSLLQISGASFFDWLMQYHFAKLQGEAASGQVRWHVVWYTLQNVFLESPILGVGYGSNLSISLGTFLLSNVGLLGFGAFLAFIFIIFRNCSTVLSRVNDHQGNIALALVLTFLPFMATLFVAKGGAGISYGTTWILLGLMEANYQVYVVRHNYGMI